jgi:hypothetical protein
VLKFANFGEGGISRLFCLDVLVPVQRVCRADERTRTAYPCSLRVRGQGLLDVAGVCISRIGRGFLFPALPTIARYCVRVRVKFRVKSAWIARGWF